MPAISFASIDMVDDSIDFHKFTPISKSNGFVSTTDITDVPAIAKKQQPSRRTLLLAPPSIAAHEEKLHALFAVHDRATSDLQMLDRLAAGFVTLTPASYDLVLVLTGTDGAQRSEALELLTRKVFTALVPAMKTGAQLQFQDGQGVAAGQGQQREAILAGLVANKDGVFEKPEEEEVVIPLRFGKKKKTPAATPANGSNGAVSLNLKSAPAVVPRTKKRPAVILDLGDYSDGDELVDEESILTAEERNRAPQQPPECKVDGQKRRKPCKDCTCGLAERMEEEDRARQSMADRDLRSVFKLDSDDLNELDFTVKGKTGSCNSCSLGDAFRCSTCPYIGLPPFKPGEEVKIMSGLVQL